MATAGELQLILTAQDDASRHLQRVGQEVQRLERQVQSANRGGGLLGGLGLGAGFQAAQQAFQAVGGIVDFVAESVVGLNARLEQTQASFEALTRSAGAAADLLAIVRQEASRGFDVRQMESAGRQLVVFAEGSRERFRELLQLAEQLAAVDPAQGIESAGFAIREALSGDFQSLTERFEVSRASIQRWREEGLTNLEIVARAIASVGGSAEAVDRLGRTFEARRTAVANFFDELRQRVGAGLFDRLNDLLARGVALIDQYGDRLRALASAAGAALAGIAERVAAAVSGPLRALVDALAPGLWDELAASVARVPEAVQATAQAAERAAPVVASLERQLGQLGVEAATLQLEATRVRRAYDDQLEPLERQLRLLQQSADLQRVQNALATNRATVERLRLEGEVSALQRAARGVEDPNAPGLSRRQRAIALALEERRLRLEELGLTEQQRPAVQALEGQIAALQEAQRRAVAPLERQLALYREQVDTLRVQQQTAELVRQANEQAITAARAVWEQGDASTVEAARKRGEELAAAWAAGFQRWVDAGGGTVWGAIGKSLNDWYTTTGKPLATRLGTDLGNALGTAASGAFEMAFGPQSAALTRIADFIERLDRFRRELGTAPAVPGGVHPDLLPRVTPEGAGVGPNQLTGGGPGVSITVENGAVQVNGQPDAVRTSELQDFLRQALDTFARGLILSQTGSDPGPGRLVQGAGRAP